MNQLKFIKNMKKIMFNDQYGLTEAVLDGRKTMTRRLCTSLDWEIVFPLIEDESKYESYEDLALNAPNFGSFCWQKLDESEHTKLNRLIYREGEVIAIAQRYEYIVCNSSFEDWEIKNLQNSKGWNNKMFIKAHLMPHQIKITNVFLQRLQDISDDDCLKEGIWKFEHKDGNQYHFKSKKYGVMSFSTAKRAYEYLIDKVCGKGTWESNPFVWVYEFELIK